MKRRLCAILVVVMLCILSGCGHEKNISAEEEQVRVIDLFESAFDENGYYYNSDFTVNYMDKSGKSTELHKFEDGEVIYFLFIQRGVFYVVTSAMDEKTMNNVFYIYKWDQDQKRMQRVNTDAGWPSSLAIAGDHIYYITSEESSDVSDVQVVGDSSYTKRINRLWKCGIEGGEPEELCVLEDEDHYNGSLMLCASDEQKGMYLVYSYAEIRDGEAVDYTSLYTWDYSGSKMKEQTNTAYEGLLYANGRIYQNRLYYRGLSEDEAYSEQFGRIDLATGEHEKLLMTKNSMVHPYSEYCVFWTRGEDPHVFLYSYADDTLLASKEPIPQSAHILGMNAEYDLVELDSTDYTAMEGTQMQDMATYGIADLKSYVKEQYQAYDGESSDMLIWLSGSTDSEEEQDTTGQSTQEQDEADAQMAELLQNGDPKVKENTIVYTDQNGEEQVLYKAGEDETILQVYLYDGHLYGHIRSETQDGVVECLDLYQIQEKKFTSLIIGNKGNAVITDVAFCPGYAMCIYRTPEEPLMMNGTEHDVWSNYVSIKELKDNESGSMGYGAGFFYGGTPRYDNQVQFDREVYREGEEITFTGTYYSEGKQMEEHYHLDMINKEIVTED